MTASYENGYFLDSNVWIYAMAHNQDINKHNIAFRLVNSNLYPLHTPLYQEDKS